MQARLFAILVCVAVLARPLDAQAPTSAIVGTVRDAAGGVVYGAAVLIVNRATNDQRTAVTSANGGYRADQLPAGEYRVTAHFAGFDENVRTVRLDVGAVATADLILAPAQVTAATHVEATGSTIDRERTGVASLISRDTIAALPLNGRNALDLVAMAPGGSAPQRGGGSRLFFTTLGSGLQTTPRIGDTRVTLDGADIGVIGGIGSILDVSPDIVDAIQISTSSFDAVTGLTANGAVNIVTRSGANQAEGRVTGLVRNHALAAYPTLAHDPSNPDPAVDRTQAGADTGGAIVTNRAFAFLDVERTDQTGAVSVHLAPPAFAPLNSVVSSPFSETLASGRVDVAIADHARLTVESINDWNNGFSPGNNVSETSTLPSGWARTRNTVSLDQVALTHVVSPAIVNEVRGSFFWGTSLSTSASLSDCAAIGATCVGVGGPQVIVVDAPKAPAVLTMGPQGTLAIVGHRAEVADTLTWQRGAHRLRLGVDWAHGVTTTAMDDHDPAQVTVFSPSTAGHTLFGSASDVLSLPLQSVQISVGSPDYLEKDFVPTRVTNTTRAFAADTWTLGTRLTASGALALSVEPDALNTDLAKPAWLVPLTGVSGLGPASTHPERAPSGGLTWAATADGRTIVRTSVGRYVDPATSANPVNLESERVALSPIGIGRLVEPLRINPLTGQPLNFAAPGGVTGGDFVGMLGPIRSGLAQLLAPGTHDPSFLNIDLTKSANDLTDSGFSQPSALHVNAGIERQVRPALNVGADVVWRRFSQTFITGIDENRWTSAGGAVIPACMGAQVLDLTAHCSNGPITFDATIGHARSVGLLVHIDHRLPRLQYTVSYTLSSFVGTNGTGPGTGFSNDNWTSNVGPLPTDRRHLLDVAGTWTLPARLAVSFNFAAASAPPFSAYLGGVDIDGDGTSNDLLPGSTVGAFGRSLDAADLVRLVNTYNEVRGTPLPAITLPPTFAFGDAFCTLDVRFTRSFGARAGRLRVEAIAEVFNLFNRRNYSAYDGNLLSPTFGQPQALASQAFGSGGPRAGQFGFRVTF
jgi:hypothetical protein